MDGGIRRGTDVVTALAGGARAVLAGRAPLWGLAVDGERGAARVLEILRSRIQWRSPCSAARRPPKSPPSTSSRAQTRKLMAERHPREEPLRRVHGTGALFSAAYGNVGSSIYYALGLVALYALGLTPVTFLIAGLIFAFTAATYVEGTVLYPEAGGSSSFARHAFNEVASFLAAWAQMLTYIVTVAISAFFVPHYLAVFWEPLGEGPADVFFGIGLVTLLALLNIKGTEESTRLNFVLALADLLTQAVLVVIGLALVFDPDLLVTQVDLGVAPTWGDFALGIAVGMVAYTGIETISNMAEEARDASRTIPRGVGATVLAVLGLYAFLPAIALSAMPVTQNAAGDFTTELGTTYADDPVLGIVDNIGLNPGLTDALGAYVGILAAVILLIATNAALIGLSRLTFSMGVHRQLPELCDGPPALQDALRRDRGLLGRRGAGDGAGRDQVPRRALRVRRDRLVHRRPHLGDAAAQAAPARRAPAGPRRQPAVVAVGQRADAGSRCRSARSSAASAPSRRGSSRWPSTR